MIELEPITIKKYKYYSLEHLLQYLNENNNDLYESYRQIKIELKCKKRNDINKTDLDHLYHLEKDMSANRVNIKNIKNFIEKVKIIIKEEIYIHHFYHCIYEKEKNIINDYNIRIAIHQIEEKYKYTKYNDFYILDNVYNTGNNKYIILIYSKLTFSGFDYFIIKNDDIYRYSNINELDSDDTGISYYIDKKEIKEKIFLLSDPIRNIKLKLNYETIEEIEQLDILKHNIENIIRRIQNGEYIDK